jgi:polar amino acid transport system substrate-binding protein
VIPALVRVGLWMAWSCWLAMPAAAQPKTWHLATIELPPSISEHAPQQGYYALILRRVLQELAAQPEFHFLPPLRVYEQVIAGQVDGAFPFKKTPEREQVLWFSEPFYLARVRVFLSHADGWTPRQPQDLIDRGLGCTLQGAQVPDVLRDAAAAGDLRLQRVPLIETCFRMLELGRVSYVLTGENTGWTAAQAMPDQGRSLRMAPWVVSEEPVHMTFPRKLANSPAKLRAFNEAVRKLRKSGELRRIELAHVPRPRSP